MVGAARDGGHELVSAARIAPDGVTSAMGYRVTGSTPVIHRGLPSPSLTVVFSLDDPIVTGRSPEHAVGPDAHRHLVLLGGLHTRPTYIAQPRVQSGIQLAVSPLVSRALLGVPAGELRALSTEGADVLGDAVTRLREQLGELGTWAERFAVLARFLHARHGAARHPEPPRAEVVAAWTWLARRHGMGSIAGLARHVLLSPRQLTTVFRHEIGLPPKAIARLMRFAHVRRRLARDVRNGTALDLASTATACGYSDHSHLVRDFQQYVGTSPTRWLLEEHHNIHAGSHREGGPHDISENCHNRLSPGVSMSKPRDTSEETWETPGSRRQS